MRTFSSDDGRSWSVVAQGVPVRRSDEVGWETILFDGGPLGQRVAHRRAGWLEAAGDDDLREALRESEPVRARWGGVEEIRGLSA